MLELILIGIAAACVAGFALMGPVSPPPVSDKVANYTPPAPTQEPPAPKVVVFGDSFGQGAGASDRTMGWIGRLQRNQGWNLTNLSRGGTGYKSNVMKLAAAQESCRLDRCLNYVETIPEARTVGPDVVLVTGGRNDAKVGPETETAAIERFFETLRKTFPRAKIIATNPLWDSRPRPDSIDRMAATIREAAQAAGGTYVDIGQPLASHPELIGPDGIHPTDAGHDVIFVAMLEKMKSAGIAAAR
ncbi:hypothetical protein ARGLB_064_01120 [Arthrobacter globiformis NBRC 12137]|uniref:SGNH hydrolase-type esterase domain-containing protein n=2 Tax=Arthrobacter globiformis TaxID=1665 RepID=H0QNE8_ARTG1|nr:hypothetical protein ARGLB_064_01120 [Arthrobacter globiformis NBRC 12137]